MGAICGSNARKEVEASTKLKKDDLKLTQQTKDDAIEDDPGAYEYFFQKLEKEKKDKQGNTNTKRQSVQQKLEAEKKRASKLESEKKIKELLSNTSLASINIITNKVSNDIKNKAHALISKGKLKELNEHIIGNKLLPQEEISTHGYYWNLIHYACHFGASHIVEFLLKLCFFEQRSAFSDIVNSRTIEGSTALMIAANYNKPECVDICLRAGAVNLGIRNKDGRTALHLANNYKAKECSELIMKYEANAELEVGEHWLTDFDRKEFVEREFVFIPAVDDDLDDKIHKENERKGPTDEVVLKSLKSKEGPLHDLIKKSINSQRNFIDDSFQHTLDSITKDTYHEHFDIFKDARWLRPHQIFKCDYSNIKLFDQIDPNDIRQGSLGVCYFLSVISALAEFPERVKKIFSQTEVNKYGVYGVNFFFQGVPTEIIVDDFFACMSDKLEPVFAKPNGNEIWVLILEKAWAKSFGSYTIVEFEVVDYAMEDILGVPSIGYWMNKLEPQFVWSVLKESDSKKYLMSATSYKDGTKEEGLVPSHAYTILSVYEIEDLKLMKLRNPWGNFEWKGKYEDESEFWKSAKSKKLNYEKKGNDGVFFMDFDEFFKKFIYLSVASYEDNWLYTFAKVNREKNHAAYFEFNIPSKTEAYFRLHQKNERLVLEDDPDYKYSPVQFQLFKKEGIEVFNGNNLKYFGRKSILCNENGRVSLEPGNYVLRTKIHWVVPNINEFVISCYSNKKVDIKEITEPKLVEQAKEVMFKTYLNISQKVQEKEKFQEGACSFSYKWHNQHCILLFENNLPDLSWKVDLELLNAEGIRMGKRHRVDLKSLSAKVKPKSKEIVIVKRKIMHAPVSFSWNLHEEKIKD